MRTTCLEKFSQRLSFLMVTVSFVLYGSSIICLLPVTSSAEVVDRAGSDTSDLAADCIQRAAMQRGVCAVLGRDRDVAIELARASELLVHVIEPDAVAVAELRAQADQAGLDIQRLVAEQGGLANLPYVDNMIDLIVATRASDDGLNQLSLKEVLRVLRPQGTAIIGKAAAADGAAGSVDKLRDWAESGGAERIVAWQDERGSWVQFYKPALKGVDQWTHWEKGPDNNPVSNDQMIRAPYMTQFMAGPYYIGMPSVTTAAAGRTFLAIGHIAHHQREWGMLNKLIARNGYNGTILWERDLPEGYLVHRSAFIAGAESFHMIDGDRCLLLDAQTGKEKGEIRIPGLEGKWKWMALKDGVLYVLAGKPGPGAETVKGDRTFGGWSWEDLSKGYYGKRIPHGFGDVLAAWHVADKKLVWKHNEESLIDSRGMAMTGDQLFLYCPDRHFRCLSATTGDIKWTNNDQKVLELIEQPGKGLTSTPGWRTQTLSVATPEVLIVQGQTRMNVVALSSDQGYMRWTKKKITNNPNAIYVDGKVILGVGPDGNHVSIEPISGEVVEDLKFHKVSCARLTASTDSFFCRGEGMLRFDREKKKVQIDGAARPACNDGAMPANGLLYLGPWQCDCNLSLIGCVARCSAGDFRFDYQAADAERLETNPEAPDQIAALVVTDHDWPTYRGNNHRTAGTSVKVVTSASRRWEFTPPNPHVPTAPTSAGVLVFVGSEDGKVRAMDAESGQLRWQFATAGVVKYPPTVWNGRAYVGSGDGHVYCLEAATGRLLWRFRAAPVERRMMVYDTLSSTWPVNTGVLVHDGVAYFAAGIVDHDGTYLYALDAQTGHVRWQNNSSGHLNAELRKGISAQGNLAIRGDQLILAGGNQISPAKFSLATGECLEKALEDGRPQANGGKFVGVVGGSQVIAGGRILYSAAENVSTKGSFNVFSAEDTKYHLSHGGVPPSWDSKTVAVVNLKHGKIVACDADKFQARVVKGYPEENNRVPWSRNLLRTLEADGGVRWKSDLDQPTKFEAVSLAVGENAIVAVVKYQHIYRARTQWHVVAFNSTNGEQFFKHELQTDPLPDGLLIDAKGQIIVTLLNGNVICIGAST